jgi:cell division protein FtsL
MAKSTVDLIQEKQIRLLFYLVATLGATTTLVLYWQNRKNRKEKDELLVMEKELKTLQLEKLKAEKKRKGGY